jgi:hypothetical protein
MGPADVARIAVAGLAIITFAVLLVAGPSGIPGASPTPGSLSTPLPTLVPAPTGPPRVVFSLPVSKVVTTAIQGARRRPKIGRQAGIGVSETLGAFYDEAFFNPVTWIRGVSPAAWAAFAPEVAARAKKDERSLTLGTAGRELQSLQPTERRLVVEVLIGADGAPISAVASVTLGATGVLTSGELLEVRNTARFLLEPSGGGWLIVGYPSARTTLRTLPAPSPSPSPEARAGSPPPTSTHS